MFNVDYFQFVNEKGSVTVSDMVEKFGAENKHRIQTWLSRNVGAGYLEIVEKGVCNPKLQHYSENRYALTRGEWLDKFVRAIGL